MQPDDKPTLTKPVLEKTGPLVTALPLRGYSEAVAACLEHVKFSRDVGIDADKC